MFSLVRIKKVTDTEVHVFFPMGNLTGQHVYKKTPDGWALERSSPDGKVFRDLDELKRYYKKEYALDPFLLATAIQ